jgi:cation diffusion facilitator CzcD-associated flavoprotein CzcO
MTYQVAVIGAGPYGLSVAAYLPEAETAVLGEPMGSWRAMPEGMYLKSVWTASSLADPARSYSLDAFAGERGISPREPIPLDFFIEYGEWFQRHAGPRVDPAQVRRLSLADRNFRLELSDGRELVAENVVVATGIRAFARVPELAKDLPPLLTSHTGDHRCLSRFRGCTVAVVGAGQSSLETAAILDQEGARVEIISRKPVLWIKRVLYGHGSPISRLLYPPTDVGPPGLNWLNAAPLLMKRLPDGVRGRIEVRSIRPAGAQWLRSRVEGRIPITEGVEIVAARPEGSGLRLTLSDGAVREVDHLIFGTGYRPDIGKVEFLDPTLRTRIAAIDGFPVLNEWFESSVAGLHFVGGLAGRTFGPICRFVAGAQIAARQVSRRIRDLN